MIKIISEIQNHAQCIIPSSSSMLIRAEDMPGESWSMERMTKKLSGFSTTLSSKMEMLKQLLVVLGESVIRVDGTSLPLKSAPMHKRKFLCQKFSYILPLQFATRYCVCRKYFTRSILIHYNTSKNILTLKIFQVTIIHCKRAWTTFVCPCMLYSQHSVYELVIRNLI